MGSDREEGDRDDEDSHFEVMQSLKAHVHHGRLVLDEPTDLPEGSSSTLSGALPVEETRSGRPKERRQSWRFAEVKTRRGGNRLRLAGEGRRLRPPRVKW